MKFHINAVLLSTIGLAAGMALAEFDARAQVPAPTPDYMAQAIAGSLTEQINQTLSWRAEALKDQDKIKELQAELDKLKAAQQVAAAPAKPADPPH